MSTLRTTNVTHGSSSVTNIQLDNQGRSIFGPDGPNGRASLYVNAQTNRVGVNNESPSVALDVDGAINATGNVAFGGTFSVTGNVNIDSGTLFVDAANNLVGVGTASPNFDLHVHDSSGSATIQLTNSTVGLQPTDGARITASTTGILYFENLENASTIFTTNNTTRMTIASNGLVGIGASTPTLTYGNGLHIAGGNAGLKLQNTNNGDWAYVEYADESNATKYIQGYRDSSGVYAIRPGVTLNAETGISLDSSGRVGIGENTMGVKFEVKDSGNTKAYFKHSSGNETSLYIDSNDTYAAIGSTYHSGGGTFKPLAFLTSGNQRMKIDAAGNVIVGSGDPDQKLVVTGTGETNFRLTGASATVGGYLYLQNTDTTNNNSMVIEGVDAQGQGVSQIQFYNVNHTNNEGSIAINTRPSGGNMNQAILIDSAGTTTFIKKVNNTEELLFGYGTSSGIYAGIGGKNNFNTNQVCDLVFFTNGSAINHTPSARMKIAGNGESRIFSDSGTSTIQLHNGSSSGTTHRLLYGVHSATSYDNGTGIYSIFTNGTVGTPSDIRLKKNVETTRDGYLADLASLRVVKYHWKTQEDSEPKELGLIAQEVEEVFPGLIHTEGEGEEETKELKRSVIPFMLLKALQEANAKIENLETRIAALEDS